MALGSEDKTQQSVETLKPHRMEGRYKVEENINFESFLKVMGVTDDDKIEEMIKATKERLHNTNLKVLPERISEEMNLVLYVTLPGTRRSASPITGTGRGPRSRD